jgi:hypothetical protein
MSQLATAQARAVDAGTLPHFACGTGPDFQGPCERRWTDVVNTEKPPHIDEADENGSLDRAYSSLGGARW